MNRRLTYFSTLRIEVSRRRAISLFIIPSATSCSTLASRGVNTCSEAVAGFLVPPVASNERISVICLESWPMSASAKRAASASRRCWRVTTLWTRATSSSGSKGLGM